MGAFSAQAVAWSALAAFGLQAIVGSILAARNLRRLRASGPLEERYAWDDEIGLFKLAYFSAFALSLTFYEARFNAYSGLFAALFLAAQAVHLWAVLTLGPRWCHRVVWKAGELPISQGPYRLLRHPIYCAVVAQYSLFAMMFGFHFLALGAGGLSFVLLGARAGIENPPARG